MTATISRYYIKHQDAVVVGDCEAKEKYEDLCLCLKWQRLKNEKYNIFFVCETKINYRKICFLSARPRKYDIFNNRVYGVWKECGKHG